MENPTLVEAREIIRETEKAIAIRDHNDEEKVIWLPKSQLEVEINDAEPELHDFTMPEWLAKDKGLI